MASYISTPNEFGYSRPPGAVRFSGVRSQGIMLSGPGRYSGTSRANRITPEIRQSLERSRGGAGMGIYPPVFYESPFADRLDATKKVADNFQPRSAAPSFLSSFGNSILAGAAGSSLDFVSNIVSAGLQYSTQNHAIDVQNALGNRELDFKNRAFDTEWNAARSAGLISPVQLSGSSSDRYGKSAGTGSQLSVAKYAMPNSVWQ